MSNFSDDEDLRPPVLAEARKEEWSDDDEGEEVGLITPAEARAGASWSDDEGGEPEKKEPEDDEPTAGAVFGTKADPIGDLRSKAKAANRKALDEVDKYVKRSGDEAKKVRAARRKISGLRDQSLKAIQRVQKDKKLSDSAKEAQRAQHEEFTKPTTGDLAEIDAQLAAQEAWLNQVLSSRKLPAAAAAPAPEARRAAGTEVEKIQIGPRSSTEEKAVTRDAMMFIPGGVQLSWVHGDRSKSHSAGPDGAHFDLKAGSKFTVSNRGSRTAVYEMFYR